jgi:hypothetical protein
MESLAGAVALILVGPPVVGAGIGATVDGENRVRGGLIGAAIGGVVTLGYLAYANAQAKAAPLPWTTQVTTLQTGTDYVLTTPSGTDATALATSSGFTSVNASSGRVMGTWSGANGASVPSGLIAKS